MDSKTKINGHYYTKKQVSFLLFSLFKTCVKINNYAFKGESLRNVIVNLTEFVDISDMCADLPYLENAITSYCDNHDTGIYY